MNRVLNVLNQNSLLSSKFGITFSDVRTKTSTFDIYSEITDLESLNIDGVVLSFVTFGSFCIVGCSDELLSVLVS